MARFPEAREDATICERLEATPFSFFSFTMSASKCSQTTNKGAACQRKAGGSTPDGKNWCVQHGQNLSGWIPLNMGMPRPVAGVRLFEDLVPPPGFTPAVLEQLLQASSLDTITKAFPFFAALIGRVFAAGMPFDKIALRILDATVVIPEHASGLFPAGREVSIISTVATHNTFCPNDVCLVESVVRSICGKGDAFDILLSGMDALALPAMASPDSDATVQSGVQSSSSGEAQGSSSGSSSSTALVMEGVTGAQSAKAFMAARLDYAINRICAILKDAISKHFDSLSDGDKANGLLDYSRVGQTLGGTLHVSLSDIRKAATIYNIPLGFSSSSSSFPSATSALALLDALETKLESFHVKSASRLHSPTDPEVWTVVSERAAQHLQGTNPAGVAATLEGMAARNEQLLGARDCIDPLCPGTTCIITSACQRCELFSLPRADPSTLSDAQLKARSKSALNTHADVNLSLAKTRAAASEQEIKAAIDITHNRAAQLVNIIKTTGADSLSNDEADALLAGTGDDRISIGTSHYKLAPGLATAAQGIMADKARSLNLYTPDTPGSSKFLELILRQKFYQVPFGALLRVAQGVQTIDHLVLGTPVTKASKLKIAPVNSAPFFYRYLSNLEALVRSYNNCERVVKGFERVRLYMEEAREANFTFLEFLTCYAKMLSEHATHVELYCADPTGRKRPDPFDREACPGARKQWFAFEHVAAVRGIGSEDEAGWFGQVTSFQASTTDSRPAKKQRKADGNGAGKSPKAKQAANPASPTPHAPREQAPATAKKLPAAPWRADLKPWLQRLLNNGVCISVKRKGAACDCNSGKYDALFKDKKFRYCINTKDEPHFKEGAVPPRLLFTPRE